MSLATGRLFSGLSIMALGRGMFTSSASMTMRRLNMRSFTSSSQVLGKSNTPNEDEVNHEPIKFSTSKASHKTWKVKRSMGSQYERPWWKVLPISAAFTAFLLWCALRGETDIDTQLEKQLYEQLPGLLSDEEEKVEDK